ncbi:hypothetical protein BY996DRAFT_6573416, partial [Phakopsora pachyrhizi]
RLEEMGMRAKYPIVLGRMEEISAEAKLLIGLCYEICFLVKSSGDWLQLCVGLRELLRFVYHLARFRLCWLRFGLQCHCDQIGWKRILVRRTDLPIKDAWRGKQMRLVMTSNGNDRNGRRGRIRGVTENLSTPCGDNKKRWMAELRIQKAAIRDWRPADQVKVWSCLQKLAEEEGEENHRLDNPFNICSSCSWGSIIANRLGKVRLLQRIKDYWIVEAVTRISRIGSNFLERSESLAVGMVTVCDLTISNVAYNSDYL